MAAPGPDGPERKSRAQTVLEAVTPHPGAFDAAAMSRGQPGVPARFDWRGKTYVVVEVLDTRREVENYSGSPKDGYARRHVSRVRTETGEVMVLAASRGPSGRAARWVLREIERSAGS